MVALLKNTLNELHIWLGVLSRAWAIGRVTAQDVGLAVCMPESFLQISPGFCCSTKADSLVAAVLGHQRCFTTVH